MSIQLKNLAKQVGLCEDIEFNIDVSRSKNGQRDEI